MYICKIISMKDMKSKCKKYTRNIIPQTSVALGVVAALVEDSIQCTGPNSVRNKLPLLPPVDSRGLP